MAIINLNVSSRKHTVDVGPKTPVLWVRRDDLKLSGSKYGYDVGQWGAFTVHLGTTAVPCQLPVSAIGDKPVTTIEGLSANSFHPLQKGLFEHDVPQCGYHQDGQTMSAAALLSRSPAPC
jgi:aerobic-type carbon monoxide dehydrogenase small subunit (CoxS/CutS family)